MAYACFWLGYGVYLIFVVVVASVVIDWLIAQYKNYELEIWSVFGCLAVPKPSLCFCLFCFLDTVSINVIKVSLHNKNAYWNLHIHTILVTLTTGHSTVKQRQHPFVSLQLVALCRTLRRRKYLIDILLGYCSKMNCHKSGTMYLWWYLHACQVRVTIGHSGLCCLLVLCMLSAN